MDRQLLDAIIKRIEVKIDATFRLRNVRDAPSIGTSNKSYILDAEPISYFVKTNTGTPKDFFEKEVDSLHMLSIAVMRNLLVPRPLLWGEYDNVQYLVMEYISMKPASSAFFEKLGVGMALLHQNTNHFYGLQEDNYVGPEKQINGKYETWNNFYIKSRVQPQMEKAYARKSILPEDVQSIENICDQLSELIPQEKPSLLHGDFWIGNVSATDDIPSVFDPSVYYGNREMDIAMSKLMGGFEESFYASYNNTFPMIKGWENRLGIHQIYPLLVLINNYNTDYYKQLKEIIKNY